MKKVLLSMQEDDEEVEESTHFCYIKHRLKLVKHHTPGTINLLSSTSFHTKVKCLQQSLFQRLC